MCEFHTRYCWNWQLCHSLSENHTHLTWWCRYAQCAHKRWLLNCDKSHQTFRLNVLKIKRTLKCSVNSQVHMLSKRWYQWWNSHLHPFDFGTLLSITNRIRKISISANSSCSFAQDSQRTQQWTYKKKLTPIEEQIDLYFRLERRERKTPSRNKKKWLCGWYWSLPFPCCALRSSRSHSLCSQRIAFEDRIWGKNYAIKLITT